jgi:hypothetical protein
VSEPISGRPRRSVKFEMNAPLKKFGAIALLLTFAAMCHAQTSFLIPVTSTAGVALSGARVTLTCSDTGNRESGCFGRGPYSAATDANGNAHFSNVTVGNYTVTVTAGGGTYSYSYSVTSPTPAFLSKRIYADQQAGADACRKIAAAWNQLPPGTSGIVDATGFAGAQVCGSNPFSGIGTKYGELWICGATFQTTASWVIPSYIKIKSCGENIGTPIGGVQAVPGFPLNTPVIQFSRSGTNFGIGVEYFTVNCFNQPGAIGIQNKAGQQGSHATGMMIQNCPGGGIDVETSGAQNSGPYFDNYIVNDSACTNCSTSTVAATFKNLVTFRGVLGLSIVSSTALTNAMAVDTSGNFGNLEFEGEANGLIIGANLATAGVIVQGTFCHHLTTCITISNANASGTGNINIDEIASDVTANLLVDQIATKTLTESGEGNSLGWYHLGGGSPVAVCSSSQNVTCNFGSSGLSTNGSIKAFGVISAGSKPTGSLRGDLGAARSSTTGAVYLGSDGNCYVVRASSNVAQIPAGCGGLQMLARFQITDEGQCTMTSGSCAVQSLGSTYLTAPKCFANWTGTGTLTGIIKVPSTATSVTPASSVRTDSAEVNWACFGN